VILLCDEDVGTGVPRALSWVDYPAHALYDCGLGGYADEDWLPIAGRGRLLVFSRNKKMLKVRRERQVIINERVGIIFFTSGVEAPASMLRLLLNKWELLEFLDQTEPRPFARFLAPNGRLMRSYRGVQL